MPATSLSRPLKRLIELGLVRRDIPFGCDEKGNKKTLYRLSDPFLRFWYSFVLPHYSDPYFLSTREEIDVFRPAFDVYLGQVWEEMVRETLMRKPLPGVQGRWRKVSRWWGSGLNRQPMEIDVLAESVDGKTLLAGEAKLSLTKREAEHVQGELDAKVRQLPFAAEYKKIITRLFVAKKCPTDAISLSWLDS